MAKFQNLRYRNVASETWAKDECDSTLEHTRSSCVSGTVVVTLTAALHLSLRLGSRAHTSAIRFAIVIAEVVGPFGSDNGFVNIEYVTHCRHIHAMHFVM